MLNLNFVPDDYIQSKESYRINIMYLVLLAITVAALGIVFTVIKTRQKISMAEQIFVNKKMANIQNDIKKYEEFEIKRKEMMKTALVTSVLLEPAPRSCLLALLTNNMPHGVSFLELNIMQKSGNYTPSNIQYLDKYEKEMAKRNAENKLNSQHTSITYITIVGIAPSDLQVATYIEKLSGTALFDNVTLVESKESRIDSPSANTIITNVINTDSSTKKYRQFKITASIKPDVYITNKDIAKVRAKL